MHFLTLNLEMIGFTHNGRVLAKIEINLQSIMSIYIYIYIYIYIPYNYYYLTLSFELSVRMSFTIILLSSDSNS